ncbi:hypothetical protein ACFQ0K_03230 [Nocardioides caeni]|uniref:Septum formation-related domain-containing protein n=1 Tax=Nocardioides caeni TaxID=574700 RepID=A0A4S8NMU2_9ACTN|nr:hypothetical protein [Nocardioides caeni]THV18178.1 hypothetical protein E9934_00565 [Nocardioides caeni]
MRRLVSIPAAALLLAATVALAGCGGDDAEEPRSERSATNGASGTDATTSAPATTPVTPTPPDLPGCSGVWVEGRRLPAGYAGCVDDAGEVSRDVRMCSIGDTLATHDDRWYAVPGRVINHAVPDLERDQAYQSAVLACTG